MLLCIACVWSVGAGEGENGVCVDDIITVGIYAAMWWYVCMYLLSDYWRYVLVYVCIIVCS